MPNLPTRATKVLLIAPWFYPDFRGGAPRLFDLLARSATTTEIVVLTDRSRHPESTEFDRGALRSGGYRVRRMRFPLPTEALGRGRLEKALRGLGRLASQWLAVARCVAIERPDVVVLGNSYVCGWLVRRLPTRAAWVNYVHGEELTMRLEYGPLSRWLKAQQLRSFRSVDLNLCVSGFSAGLVAPEARSGGADLAVVPNAVDVDAFVPPPDRESARRELGWNGAFVLLTVARLESRKGIDRTLRALARCRWAGREWLYCIAGTGTEGARLQALAAELGIAANVRFLGFVPDAMLPTLYGAADVFVQTNVEVDGDTEGFGIVFLEASACGTPVIGGTAGGTADAIEEGVSGFRVDGEDIEAIRARIERLADDPALRERMARNGRRRAAEGFSAQACAARFDAAIDALAARRRSWS
ncbi:MAG: hypothetical protein RJA99_533 [Pseudomonadota bacterium]|jgi:phosphatidylinositol alpha-1,6-mannosyltransferase